MPSFRIQYPKLALLCASFLAAYLLYLQGVFDLLPQILNGQGYISMFLAGALFTLGFTAPFGVFILLEIAPEVHALPAALVAGFGAVIVDMLIFKMARFSLHEELHRLAASGLFRRALRLLYHERVSDRIRSYVLWSVAGIVIASPLPDEIGVTLLSAVSTIETRKLGILCFALNTTGIFIIILGAQAVA